MTEQATPDEKEPASRPDPSPSEPTRPHLAKVRSWLSAKWLRWAVGIVLGAALTVYGTSLAQWTETGAHHLISGSGRQIARATPIVPLAATVELGYSDAGSLALADPVTSGLGYADLLAGPSDTNPQNSWANLLARYDGAAIGELHVDIVLTGQDKTPVRVTNVQIQRVGPVMSPLSGSYIPIPHAGAQSAYQFKVNMDAPYPVIRRLSNGQTFPDFNVQLADGDQLTLSVDFLAKRYSFRWVLLVTYLTGTRKHILKVEAPNGHPFAVTAQAKRYKVVYVSNFPWAGYQLSS